MIAKDPEVVRARLLQCLTEFEVEVVRIKWLPLDETRAIRARWVERGYQRYGRLALIALPGTEMRWGECEDGEVPEWLDTSGRDREVLLMFFAPPGEQSCLASCTYGFALDNLVRLARCDGEGFAALTPGLEGALLVNVDVDLGGSRLQIDAWGDFVRT
jgi:hypothetical protein